MTGESLFHAGLVDGRKRRNVTSRFEDSLKFGNRPPEWQLPWNPAAPDLL